VSNLSDAEQVLAGLELLVDCDWLADIENKTGGRAKVTYRINSRAVLFASWYSADTWAAVTAKMPRP
jgi:hypothetical protein